MATENNKEAQFTDTPAGWASRLSKEFESAKKALKEWHEQAEKAISEYLDEREGKNAGDTKFNLYTADSQTREAILFGNPPKAAVSRRYADANDDVARVASEILERLVNADIEGDDDTFSQAVEYAHSDRERTAFGLCRVRYVAGEPVVKPGVPAITKPHPQTGEMVEVAPEVPATETRPNEQVETDYVHWRDVVWNSCRVWHEVETLFFRSELTYTKMVEKFGEDVVKQLPTKSKKEESSIQTEPSPWDRYVLWEVWVKENRHVFFWVQGYAEVLKPEGVEVSANGGVPDPLGLNNFWPCPRPMFGNTTTSKLVPKPDREFAKDLYAEINDLATRITMLEQAVRVTGGYDATATALGQMLNPANSYENKLYPVDNWAMFAEKGGIKGAVDFMPLEEIIKALVVLREERRALIEDARQITGMADIMRGQSSVEGGTVTATEQRIKARFGSVRMERRQKELARFASDLQRLRAEVMAKHFDESTLLARCNCENTPDAPLAQEAVKLIKQDFSKYRIEVKPETISMTDFDALKQERTDVIGAIASFFQAAAPMASGTPGSMPFMLQILQWMVAGLRGSAEIEGVLDQAIQAAKQQAAQPQQQQQDPKLQTEMLKGQQEMAKIQAETQAKASLMQMEVQADAARETNQREQNVMEHAQKQAISAAYKPAFTGPVNGGQR